MKNLLTQLSSTLRATPPLALFLEIVAHKQGGSVTKTQFFKSLQTQLIMRPIFHDVGCKFYHFFSALVGIHACSSNLCPPAKQNLNSTQYKKLAQNALQFTSENLKSCKSHE